MKRKSSETIPEYGARVNQILRKLTIKVMENAPQEKALGICEACRVTSKGNFIGCLVEDIYSQIRDKEINSLDTAIALANQANFQWRIWNRIHNSNLKTDTSNANNTVTSSAFVPKTITEIIMSSDPTKSSSSSNANR